MLSAIVVLGALALPASVRAESAADHAPRARRAPAVAAPARESARRGSPVAGFLERHFGVRGETTEKVIHALDAARGGDVAEIHRVTADLLATLGSEEKKKALDDVLQSTRASAGGDAALGGLVAWLQEARRHVVPPPAKVTRGPASELPRNQSSFRSEITQHPEITNRSSCFSMWQIVHANWSLDDEPCTKACSLSFPY